jgi:DNA-binding GntR family transcriptional regulator
MTDGPVFDPRGPALVWAQISGDIAGQVQRGELAAGDRLPSEAALAEHYGAARGTVRRALADLRDRGLIVTVFGKGTFVAGGS